MIRMLLLYIRNIQDEDVHRVQPAQQQNRA